MKMVFVIVATAAVNQAEISTQTPMTWAARYPPQ